MKQSRLLICALILLFALPVFAQDDADSAWTTFTTQNGRIFGIALNPDETIIATISAITIRQNQELAFIDFVLEVFDLETGERLVDIPATDDDKMDNLAFSPDGTLLAVGYYTGDIEIYDTESFEQIGFVDNVYSGGGRQFEFSPDGQYIIGERGTTNVVSTDDWTIIASTWGANEEFIIHAAVSPDSTQFATTDFGDSLNIHDIETGEILESFEGLFDNTGFLFWNTDETIIFESERALHVFDIASGESTIAFNIDGVVIQTMVLSPDNTQALVSTFENTLTLWDIATGEMLVDFPLETYRGPRFADFGETMIAVAEDSTVYVQSLGESE